MQDDQKETAEQAAKAQNEVKEEQAPETPSVKEEAEAPKDPNLVDESGVLWKNRAKEYERKYHSTLEKFSNFQRAPEPEAPKDDEEIPATRSGVKQVLSELSREESVAEQVLDEVISELSIINPEVGTLKSKIASQLKTVDVRQRKDPNLIKAVAYAVYGEAAIARKPEAPKPVKKLVSNVVKSDVLTPNPQGGDMSESKLTAEEEDYAFSHRLKEKGFDNDEIHDLYVRANKKK